MVQSTTRAFASPQKYIQGPGEFNRIETYTRNYGDRVFFIIDSFLYNGLQDRLESIYRDTSSCFRAEAFQGECCAEEADRLIEAASAFGASVIVGAGGGKVLDTAKIVAGNAYPLIVLPTAASSDAPTSAISVLYTKDGVYKQQIRHRQNPGMVLMDTEILVKAPLRLFAAGMADALATMFEARANMLSDSPNYITIGYRRTKAAMAIAELSYQILLEDGLKAITAVQNGVVNEAFENVIEANTLLSGLGFENTGCAAAHSVHTGLTAFESTHKYLHGEKVAFGIVCQMALENAPVEELKRIYGFLHALGMPITLAQLDVEATEENLQIMVDKMFVANMMIFAEPFVVTKELVISAIRIADAMGKKYLATGTVV